MAPPITCNCGTCSKCKHRAYMNGYYERNAATMRETSKRSRRRRIGAARAYDRGRGFRGDPAKTKARNAARVLERQPCEGCGAPKADAHHDDYAKPLDVRWLCEPCHGIEHRRVA